MLSGLWIGLGACAAWAAILLHASRRPAARLWPPRRPTVLTVVWSWGLTIAIYVGLVRLGSAEGNVLDLPQALRWGLGGALTVGGSLLQSWGTATLGLKATSGWPAPRATRGPYRVMSHPQYAGQAASFAGIALISGGALVWIVALAGALALAFAARVEHVHLPPRG